jgi:Fervidolysin N-terminal prodomain
MNLPRLLVAAVLGLVLVAPAATGSHGRAGASDRWDAAPVPTAVVGYRSRADLARVLRAHPGVVLRTIPALGVAEVLPRTQARDFAQAAHSSGGIAYVEPPVVRRSDADPALRAASSTVPGSVLEWQYPAVHVDGVPASVKRGRRT